MERVWSQGPGETKERVARPSTYGSESSKHGLHAKKKSYENGEK
jgi:hypothetical protein